MLPKKKYFGEKRLSNRFKICFFSHARGYIMGNKYTELERIFRWLKLAFMPIIAIIFIIVCSYKYLGFTYKQAISYLSPDCSLAILSIMVSIYGVATDIEKELPPKTKENFSQSTMVVGIYCLLCYAFTTIWYSEIERVHVYMICAFLFAVAVSACIGICFTKKIHKMQMDEAEKQNKAKQLLEDEQKEKNRLQEELEQVKKCLENNRHEKEEIQKELEAIQKELSKKTSENLALKSKNKDNI